MRRRTKAGAWKRYWRNELSYIIPASQQQLVRELLANRSSLE